MARPSGLSKASLSPNSQYAIATVAAAAMTMATLVPMCRALASALVSVDGDPFTKKEPTIEASIPARAMAIGNDSSEMFVMADACSAPSPRAKATSEIGARIDPA